MPGNYRGIAVMATAPKLLAHVLLKRLEDLAEAGNLRAATQAGFRRGARLEDNQLLLLTALQHTHHLRLPLHILFVDLTKAYDSIHRGHLWHVLVEELGIPDSLVGQVKRLYEDLRVSIVGAE